MYCTKRTAGRASKRPKVRHEQNRDSDRDDLYRLPLTSRDASLMCVVRERAPRCGRKSTHAISPPWLSPLASPRLRDEANTAYAAKCCRSRPRFECGRASAEDSWRRVDKDEGRVQWGGERHASKTECRLQRRSTQVLQAMPAAVTMAQKIQLTVLTVKAAAGRRPGPDNPVVGGWSRRWRSGFVEGRPQRLPDRPECSGYHAGQSATEQLYFDEGSAPSMKRISTAQSPWSG
jgi:hypothetical protein